MNYSILFIAGLILCIFIIRKIKQYKSYKREFGLLLPKINTFQAETDSVLQAYISHSIYINYIETNKNLIQSIKRVCPYLNKQDKATADHAISKYQNIKENVKQINQSFVEREKRDCRSLFADISGLALDEQQQDAIAIDEDHNLVIAGAGSGKTLTITGKVKYLCEHKHINPKEILLIAFTNKAAGEMTERIQRLGISIEAVTFHKLGLSIISHAKGYRPNVLEDNEFTGFLEDYFKNNVVQNTNLVKSLIEYFAYYLHIPADMDKFDSLGAAFEHERNSDFETLRSKYLSQQAAELKKKGKTLNGEYVKSLEEITIANFLFLNGIDYDYERQYPYDNGDPFHKKYTPDFYLPEYDIYLEHFGINKNGKLPWLPPDEEAKYLEGISWKRNVHQYYRTKLIETYSWYNSEGILLKKLEEILRENGVKFKQVDYLSIFDKVYNDVGDKYFHEFIQLYRTFITLFKANGYSLNDLENLNYKSKDYKNEYHTERMRLFKSIIRPILDDYQKMLHQKDKVDFSDMIIEATKVVENGFQLHPYKYIIIDEFQDVSISRYKLIKAITEQTGAHLLCVGDDWQSIYRFSGSDLSVFTDFEKAFGATEVLRIEKTYRNSQQLINSAAGFVMKNPAQIKKSLRSDKYLPQPVCFYTYRRDPLTAITAALDEIASSPSTDKSVLILGRTKYDENVLLESGLFKIAGKQDERRLFYKKYDLSIQFMTVHKAKGLEAGNVIILNFNNSLLGFPNKIADDPILELVLSTSDTFLYGEERRLLYVALTRTKNKVYLITNESNPSEFMHDFANDPNTITNNPDGTSVSKVYCPKCKTGRLMMRANEKTKSNFVGCSNYPKCDFTNSDLTILTNPFYCKACGGLMIKRKSYNGIYYRCINYPACKYTTNNRPKK